MDNSLKDVYIPESVEEIGQEPFFRCGLISITVDNNNKKFDSRNNCNAIVQTTTNTLIQASSSTVIPSSVTGLGSAAFGYVDTKVVKIPESVVYIASAS